MNLRALLPICLALAIIAGCTQQPSKEYLEALADFDAVTVKMNDLEFESKEKAEDRDFNEAMRSVNRMEKLYEDSRIITERLNHLRHRIPNPTLYAQAMKDRERIEKEMQSLRFIIRQKSEPLSVTKEKQLALQRALYEATERSLIHEP